MQIEKWNSKLSIMDDAETFFQKLLDERYKGKGKELLKRFYKCAEKLKGENYMENKFKNCDMAACKYFKGHDENCSEPDANEKCCDIDWCYYKALATYKTLYEESKNA